MSVAGFYNFSWYAPVFADWGFFLRWKKRIECIKTLANSAYHNC